MNAEIEMVRKGLEKIYHRQRGYLSAKPDAFVADLKHECESLRHHESHMVRIAAGINQAACEIVEESRKKGTS